MKPTPTVKNAAFPAAAEENFNGNFTAIPKDVTVPSDADVMEAGVDYGEMNESDARESGYVGPNGTAVEKARGDVEGSPTGAYTDVGAGRSSVVHKKH
jgi:hypothetical protein